MQAGKPPQIGAKVGRLAPDVCRNDVRVSRIKASSFGVFALIVVSINERIQVDAAMVPVPNGNCAPAANVPAFPGANPGAVPGANPAGTP
jgi:hypothetical protein